MKTILPKLLSSLRKDIRLSYMIMHCSATESFMNMNFLTNLQDLQKVEIAQT